MVTPVAVKIKPGAVSVEKFLREAELMKHLSHDKLIKLYGVCTKEEPIYIVMELATNGILLTYLRGGGRSLKQPQLIAMCGHIAAGMAYLESQNCVHGDLAARNVLVTDKLVCKVANFRLAASIRDNIRVEQGVIFPIKWSAPEVLINNQFSIKSDVWSFGIFLYEVITHGRCPYPGRTNAQVRELVPQGFQMSQPEGCPWKLYVTMTVCWTMDPKARYTFERLQFYLEHFYTAKDLDYNSIDDDVDDLFDVADIEPFFCTQASEN